MLPYGGVEKELHKKPTTVKVQGDNNCHFCMSSQDTMWIYCIGRHFSPAVRVCWSCGHLFTRT